MSGRPSKRSPRFSTCTVTVGSRPVWIRPKLGFRSTANWSVPPPVISGGWISVEMSSIALTSSLSVMRPSGSVASGSFRPIEMSPEKLPVPWRFTLTKPKRPVTSTPPAGVSMSKPARTLASSMNSRSRTSTPPSGAPSNWKSRTWSVSAGSVTSAPAMPSIDAASDPNAFSILKTVVFAPVLFTSRNRVPPSMYSTCTLPSVCVSMAPITSPSVGFTERPSKLTL